MHKTVAQVRIAGLIVLLCAVCLGAQGQGSGRAALTSAGQRPFASPIRLPDQSGKLLRLSDYRGQVVLLDFWATSCGGCRAEIPWYVDFESAYGRTGLAVIGASMDVSYEDLRGAQEAWKVIVPFAQEYKMNYPIVLGDDQAAREFNVYAYPATFLIDANGRIAASYIGVVVDKNVMERNIRALLAERKSAK